MNNINRPLCICQCLFDRPIALNIRTKCTFVTHKTTNFEFVACGVNIYAHIQIASKLQGVVMVSLDIFAFIATLHVTFVSVSQNLTWTGAYLPCCLINATLANDGWCSNYMWQFTTASLLEKETTSL